MLYGRTNSFTFEGTYSVTISGEERLLSVCENKDGVIYWGLTTTTIDDPSNIVYAVGRDPNGIQRRNIKGKEHNIYEAEGDSFWLKENEPGAHTIQYYLKYNENKKYLKYTLSTAIVQDDSDSINNVYALQKVSDDVLGECFMPGDISFSDAPYPSTLIHDSTFDGPGDNFVHIEETQNHSCWGLYEISSDSIIDGGWNDIPQFEWDNKLKIMQGYWATNPCCPTYTVIALAQYYDNYEYYNTLLFVFKCVGSNLGGTLRYVETDRDFGECLLFDL